MSQNYDPNDPAREHAPQAGRDIFPGHDRGYPAGQDEFSLPDGSGYGSGPGFAAGPPSSQRGHFKHWLIATGAVALAAGATVGGLIGTAGSTAAGTATATSKAALSASQIASRLDPGLVDVVAADGDQDATSAGTGIVLSSDGEVLTNNHVIEGATSVKVTDIGNGQTYTATVVGYDATQDVAVLRLQGASGLTTASVGDSAAVQTGNNVTALGNAAGKGGTPSVATGTVTALNQSITASDELSGASEQLTGLIETNAPIQPGDSGGPLVNVYGQVIGIDTAASSSYQFQGQSGQGTEQAYSIPIDAALSIARRIERGTTTSDIHIGATAFLGLEIAASSSGADSGLGGFGGPGGRNSDGSTSGVIIVGTLFGSPAADAGLTAGDVITSIGGQTVSTAEEIAQALVKYHPGNSVSISWVDSSGQSHTATLTLASGPAA